MGLVHLSLKLCWLKKTITRPKPPSKTRHIYSGEAGWGVKLMDGMGLRAKTTLVRNIVSGLVSFTALTISLVYSFDPATAVK